MLIITILLIIILSPIALVCGIFTLAILYAIVEAFLDAIINAVKSKMENKSG